MPRPSFSGAESDRQFNNADSFAAAFDLVWRRLTSSEDAHHLNREERLDKVLNELSEHPFASMDAVRAREVGEFRLRLHGL